MWQGVVSRNTPESHNVMAVSVPCFGTRLPQFRCWHIEVIEVMSMNEVMSRRHHEVEAVQVQDGVVAKKSFVYQCPFCNGLVNSNVKTGQINHRSVCNNQLYVKDGEVSKQTRRHTHSCPVCSTVVWSSLSCGRIAVTHDMPSGKPCHKKQWHVPEKKTTKTKTK